MAGGRSIKGLTVTIDGDTTGLSKALQNVNKEIKDTQAQLKDVDKLLKLTKTDYYKFLTAFDPNELRDSRVLGELISFWQGNTTPLEEVEAKNA